MRPTQSTFFQIYNSEYALTYSLDVSVSPYYEISVDNKVIINTPGISLVEKATYFIIFGYGLVTGLEGCGTESTAVLNSRTWNFTVSKFFAIVVTKKV